MLDICSSNMREFVLDSVRCLLTLIAGLLPIVLGVVLLIKRKWYSGRPLHIVAILMTFLAPFDFVFVSLLLSSRSRRLPWYESLLIAFLTALVMSGMATTGWLIQLRPFRRRNSDE
jgi:hypothetical protein